METRLMTTAETAAVLNVPMSTLHKWAWQGTGPRYYKVGRHRRYRVTDVEEWLAAHAHGGAS